MKTVLRRIVGQRRLPGFNCARYERSVTKRFRPELRELRMLYVVAAAYLSELSKPTRADAWHEAAHAVVSVRLGLPLSIFLLPSGNSVRTLFEQRRCFDPESCSKAFEYIPQKPDSHGCVPAACDCHPSSGARVAGLMQT